MTAVRHFTVETLSEGDLVGLAQAYALDATVFPHVSLPMLTGADRGSRIWTARAMRDGQSTVIGFACADLRAPDALDIMGLAVDRAHRRQGVGRALLRAAIAGARDAPHVRRVTLHVSTTNTPAIVLYESEAFHRAERRRGFYSAAAEFGDGGDAWRMVLVL